MSKPLLLITGTSRGIGLDLAKAFVALGYNVAGCSRSQNNLLLDGYDHSCIDVSIESQVSDWIRQAHKKYGKIDALICNAGLAPARSLLTMTDTSLVMPVLQTNIAGVLYSCRAAAKLMGTQRHGRIVTISTMAVGLHEEGTSLYSASKSAIVEMTKILAKEVAPLGITCNVLAPSMYHTDALAALGEDVIQKAKNKLTIKREVTCDELVNALTFFFSPDARCITGQVMHMGLVC